MEQEKKVGKGIAITALVFGILAIITSFIPVVNLAAFVFATFAIIFGIIGTVKKRGPMAIIGLVLGGVALITAIVVTTVTTKTIGNSLEEAGLIENASSTTTTTKEKNKKYGLGDTFKFDDLELTLDSTYSFVTVNNQFSELNGRSVVQLGVTVRNLSEDTHSLNMFYYDVFGSNGTELDGVTAYFDDNIDFKGDLKPDASYHTYFYLLYDGDGKYSIDFNNYRQKVYVEFNVQK